MSENDFLSVKGNYRDLRCFRLAEHLYDVTFVFCERFIAPGDRTSGQMIQAARSIKQNIAEGSCAAAMSTQSEMLLTNVGKSSQQELLLDFEDFLVTRGFKRWKIGDPQLENARQALRQEMSREFMIAKARSWNAETLANVAITLIHQCDRMLAGLLAYQKHNFMTNGGIKEQMTKARLEVRDNQADNSDDNPRVPLCPKCGKPMRCRKGTSGYFWGCSNYPECKGTRPIDQSSQRPQSSLNEQALNPNQSSQRPQSSQSSLNEQALNPNQSSQRPQSSQRSLSGQALNPNQSSQRPQSSQSSLSGQAQDPNQSSQRPQSSQRSLNEQGGA